MSDAASLARARSLEGAIATLRGIRKAMVKFDGDGRLVVDAFVVPELPEETTRTEIGRLARAEFGTERQLCAINLLTAASRVPSSGEMPRRRLSSLTTRRTREEFSTQVQLSMGGDVLSGEAQTQPGRMTEAVGVAEAVVDGLHQLSRSPVLLEAVDVLRVGEETMAVVALMLGDRRLIGGAEVKFDLHDAVARATLHALNRTLTYTSRTA